MSKLIVFYSRADENYFEGEMRYIKVGNTEKIACKIAEKVNGDLFKLEQEIPYAKDYKTCIAEAKKDKESNARPKLVSLPESLDAYDEIYLGYPNYWGTMPMAVYTFLDSFDFIGKKIYPFCTHEGSGLSNTERDIQHYIPDAIVEKSIAICGSEVDDSDSLINKWLSK